MVVLHVDRPLPEEPHPPVIEKIEVFPYPDLARLWLRLRMSPFRAFPNVEVYVYDSDAHCVAEMLFVEQRTPYINVTLHLRQPPRPRSRYRLEAFVIRDGEILDHKEHEFALVFVDPKTGKPADPETGQPLTDNGRQ